MGFRCLGKFGILLSSWRLLRVYVAIISHYTISLLKKLSVNSKEIDT